MLKTDGYHAIREHAIWWSNCLKNKKGTCTINEVTFNIYDYDKYIDTPDDIYQYKHEKNRKYLLEYSQ